MIQKGLFFLLLLLPVAGFAQDVRQQTQQRQQIENEIALIDKQLASNQVQRQSGLQQLGLLQKKIVSRKQLLADVDARINQLAELVGSKEEEIDRLKAERKILEDAYLRLLYQAYIHRDHKMWIMYLMASESINQAYRRWRYFKSFSEYMRHQAVQITRVNERLEGEKTALLKLHEQARILKQERQAELTTLNKEEDQSQEMIRAMARQERTLKAQLKQKQQEIDKLNKEIERIMAEAAKKLKKAGAKEQGETRALSATFEQNKGRLPWPLKEGVILESFGEHNHPVFTKIKMPFNNGITISGNKGDEAYAVFQGIVKQVLFMPGYGQCVLVQHGEYYTFYCKLATVSVKSGDKLATGTTLGVLAQTDGDYALHFQVWKGTQKQNPELWLKKR